MAPSTTAKKPSDAEGGGGVEQPRGGGGGGGGVEPRQPQAKRCMLVVMLVVILLALFAIVVIWLAVQPKKLIFSIEHSSIKGFNSSSGGGAAYHCLLRSRNPNKRVSFQFKKIDLEVTYYGKKVFEGGVGPFRQPVRNATDIEVDAAAAGGALRGKTGEALAAERAAGTAKMEVKVVGKIHMKIGVFKVHRTVVANCGPYDVAFSEAEGFRRVECDTEISY